MKRNDLILPIYFVDTKHSKSFDATDDLVRIIASRQRQDLRHLRLKEFESSEEVLNEISTLAGQICEALNLLNNSQRIIEEPKTVIKSIEVDRIADETKAILDVPKLIK